eukprot:3260851-Rhodomonas_salina.9
MGSKHTMKGHRFCFSSCIDSIVCGSSLSTTQTRVSQKADTRACIVWANWESERARERQTEMPKERKGKNTERPKQREPERDSETARKNTKNANATHQQMTGRHRQRESERAR